MSKKHIRPSNDAPTFTPVLLSGDALDELRVSYHQRRHRGFGPDRSSCFKCQRHIAVCKSKIEFSSFEETLEWCDDFNETRGWGDKIVAPYRCIWGSVTHWHMATAKHGRTKKKVRRRHRKLLIAELKKDS